MYIWNIGGLKKALVNNELTEKTKFLYIFIFLAATAIAISVENNLSGLVPAREVAQSDYWKALLNATLLIGGALLVYKANGGATGRHFADRFFSLGFVSTIRVAVFTLPLFIAAQLVNRAFDVVKGDSLSAFTVVGLATTLITYLYIAKHTQDVANAGASTIDSTPTDVMSSESSELAAQGSS